MTQKLEFEVEWLDGTEGSPPERYTFAQIQIRTGRETATVLEDTFARTVRPWLRAPAYGLAAWFAENWWRLRWEPESATTDWRLSHAMGAAAGGVAWPNLYFVSDGVHVLVVARKTRDGRGMPVHYLRDVDEQISVDAFEIGVDGFVERVLARLSAVGEGQTDLAGVWAQLSSERRDHGVAERRRLEALLGFDVGEAPQDLINQLEARTAMAGRDAVREIAAATRTEAAKVIDSLVGDLRTSTVHMRAAHVTDLTMSDYRLDEQPWQRAAVIAQRVRQSWGVKNGPVPSEVLADLLGVQRAFLSDSASAGPRLGAGLRAHDGNGDLQVILRARLGTGRRFEALRLFADHITGPAADRLLPVTTAKTDRQKFQRAFAQEFLLPFAELEERLGRTGLQAAAMDDEEIEDVARQYIVSPLVVRTLLVNKGLLPRETLIA